MTPDISLCVSLVKKDCPRAPSCYRATAEPADHQSWFADGMPGKDCKYFMPNEDKRGGKEK